MMRGTVVVFAFNFNVFWKISITLLGVVPLGAMYPNSILLSFVEVPTLCETSQLPIPTSSFMNVDPLYCMFDVHAWLLFFHEKKLVSVSPEFMLDMSSLAALLEFNAT